MARRSRGRRKKYKLNWQIKKLNNFRFLPENSKEMNESVGAGRSIAAKDGAEKEWKEKNLNKLWQNEVKKAKRKKAQFSNVREA